MTIKGNGLYQLLIELTGLDQKAITQELDGLLYRLGLDADTLTTDDMRRVLAVYLEECQDELFASEEALLTPALASDIVLTQTATEPAKA